MSICVPILGKSRGHDLNIIISEVDNQHVKLEAIPFMPSQDNAQKPLKWTELVGHLGNGGMDNPKGGGNYYFDYAVQVIFKILLNNLLK